MNKQQLLDSAKNIPPVSAAAAAEYADQQDQLANEVSRLLLQREDLDRLIGTGNRAMMEDNHRNHARFIASLMQSFDPQVLVESILWVFRAYRDHGFQLTYWPAQLNAWLVIMKQQLSTEVYHAIEPLYTFMLVHLPVFSLLSDADSLPLDPCSGASHA